MKRNRTLHLENARKMAEHLTLEQKLLVISGTWEERAEAGLPRLEALGEAAHGVQARHDQSFDLGEPVYTTVFQNPVGFAATWDKELMYKVGEIVGIEGRSLYKEDKHEAICMLAPTVDMERDPRWGRNEEAYGEDPHLTSRIAGAYILGMAGEDPDYVRCGATLKHFYGNNVEHDRSLCNSNISDELKDSYYIHVFEEIIDHADPMGVMSSYNYVNGVPNTFNPEITTRLKDRGLPYVTGDGGVIGLAVNMQKEAKDISDAMVKAIHAGMDMFPEDRFKVREGLKQALSDGRLTEADIDKVLMNRLMVYSMLGLIGPAAEEENTPFPAEMYNLSKVNTKENRGLARLASSEAAVLLKNEKQALPLKKEDKVLLLGPFADRCPLDWYSGITDHQVTLKEGLGERVTAAESLYPCVYIRLGEDYAGLEGIKVVPVDKAHAELFRIMLWDDARITLRSVRTGKLLTSHNPEQKIINAEVPEAEFSLHAFRDEAFSWFVQEAFLLYDADGKEIHFTDEDALRFWEDKRIAALGNVDGRMPVSFETVKDAEVLLDEAVGKAEGQAYRVLASFGLHPMVNGKEERDRTSIELPPFQRAMLRKIRERFPEVVLVLHTNSPIAIVEEDKDPKVSAILWMATGSEEYGNSLTDVLYGETAPAGCLCQTWYRGDEQLADITDYDIKKNHMTYLYMEEEPLYHFGYGLTYTEIRQEILSADGKTVTVRVENAGASASDAVVQIYLKKGGGYRLYESKSHPGDRLSAFERVKELQPGEVREVSLSCRY